MDFATRLIEAHGLNDMSTAPKDGTTILAMVAFGDCSFVTVRYSVKDKAWNNSYGFWFEEDELVGWLPLPKV